MTDRITAELTAIAGRLETGDPRRFVVDDAPRLLGLARAVHEIHKGSDSPYYPAEGSFCVPSDEWSPCETEQALEHALFPEEGAAT